MPDAVDDILCSIMSFWTLPTAFLLSFPAFRFTPTRFSNSSHDFFSEGFLLFIARTTEKDNNKQHLFMINQGPSQDLQCMATSSRHFEKPSEKLVPVLTAWSDNAGPFNVVVVVFFFFSLFFFNTVVTLSIYSFIFIFVLLFVLWLITITIIYSKYF